jgi:hypothetical protein
VTRSDEDGPLDRVWRLPYDVAVRAEPIERAVEARIGLADEPAATVTGESPLTTLSVERSDDVAGDVPELLPVEPATQVVTGDEPLTGGDAVEALEAALDEEPEARWSLEIRWDPLRPPRLERLEQLEREASAAS